MLKQFALSQSYVFFDEFIKPEHDDPPVIPPPDSIRSSILLNHFLLLYTFFGVAISVAVFLAFKLIQIWFAWENKNGQVKNLQRVSRFLFLVSLFCCFCDGGLFRPLSRQEQNRFGREPIESFIRYF